MLVAPATPSPDSLSLSRVLSVQQCLQQQVTRKHSHFVSIQQVLATIQLSHYLTKARLSLSWPRIRTYRLSIAVNDPLGWACAQCRPETVERDQMECQGHFCRHSLTCNPLSLACASVIDLPSDIFISPGVVMERKQQENRRSSHQELISKQIWSSI